MVNASSASGNAQDRREYFRMKQQEHRRKVSNERRSLSKELVALEAQVRNISSIQCRETKGEKKGAEMLPWQVVAHVFRAATGRSKTTHNDLTRQTAITSARIHELMRFLQDCRPSPMPSLLTFLPTMQYVTLPAHPETRLTAKQWLTQQLYHNTDRVFASFPHDHDVFVHTEVHVADASHIEITEMFQVIVDLPLHLIVQGFYTNIPTRVPEIDHSEGDGNTQNYRSRCMQPNAYLNVLEGHFHEANRCVLVARYIQDDETCARPSHIDARYSLQWMDSRQVNANQTLVRVSKAHMGDIPRAEIAARLQCPLDAIASLDDDVLSNLLTSALRTQTRKNASTLPADFLALVANLSVDV
ncbi:Aste57867_12371 [Aphanomyces stellatus]|uniref:Aste57867_12371 protein n=1 Tax=Aphanomyces stellatus TaxID=120398 RepID=A0A485KVF3_9STRA|nr:hypothetical protein As57867_012325 [Aphanomyces stellatus]VFT89223.1 Aste57867_12371 [Aphanomyces stellatus]